MSNKKVYDKQYYLENKEERKERSRQWRFDHREETDKYYRDNREEKIKYIKQYSQTPKGKIVYRKHDAKRRQLGFIPLNEPFIDCEGHHISQNFVIYMPKELHQSLYHNIWTWQGMEQMNKLAIEFL
jgi:hypothetical protein